jgi:hypothetical protein
VVAVEMLTATLDFGDVKQGSVDTALDGLKLTFSVPAVG